MSNLLPYEIEWRSMPLGLGTALRVPVYAWKNWGITPTPEEFSEYDALNLEGYRREWNMTTQQGLDDINQASQNQGLGEANTLLNEANAEAVVAYYANKPNYKIKVLDLGSGTGSTTMAFVDKLSDSEERRTYVRLVDLANKSKRIAESRLVESDVDFYMKPVPETIRGYFLNSEENQFDVIIGNASVHHDADFYPTCEGAYRLLKNGGIFVTTDWHNSLWEHPARVYAMLDALEWETKEEDMAAFRVAYPLYLEDAPETRPLVAKANDEIGHGFWPEYAKVRTTNEPQYLILEGHRPAEKYMEDMERAGFTVLGSAVNDFTKDNPHNLRPDSELHSRIVAVKKV